MKLWRLEAIRGFSALYVVIHHTINNLSLFGINIGLLFRFGQEAVILFFLISGFVIGYSYHSGSDKSFKNYFSKRFFRIYIPLFFVFTLGYVVTCIGKGEIINPRLDILVKNIS